MNNQVVIFDFDETLVLENSLGFMFQGVASKSYWLAALPAVVRSFLSGQFGFRLRRNIKQALYEKHLAGVSSETIRKAGVEAASRLTVNTVTLSRLTAAQARGDTVIVATASPRLFVSAVLDQLNICTEKVIGTEIDFATGAIIGDECSRQAKWTAVFREIGGMKFKRSLAYGNAPDDIFMLEQVDEGFLVKGQKVSRY
ncbi:HAD family hydrolase [Amphritea sp.]|uniref:HAD family hydrolase n=1 Tax=Amphritea sp. TaxID=1872502 RepID=UPI003D13CC52